MSLKNKINGIKEIWQFENRWHLLFNRIFFSQEKINVYRYKHFEILIDHSAGDANGAREILTSDMYRKYVANINLSDPVNVLDLGANNGGFPLLLESENLKIKKLVCVEFNPKTFTRMRFNIERNLSCEFYPLNAALTDRNKILDVSFGKTGTSDNIYRKKDNSDTVKIKGLSFNEIYNRYFENETVSICKMDVEGAEFEVFAAENFSQLKNIEYLLLEIHHEQESPRELIQNKLSDLGFEEIEKELKSDEFHHVHFFTNKEFLEK